MLDGLSATIMDESLLRGEPLLWRYWTAVSWLSYKESRAAVTSRKSTLQVHQAYVHGFGDLFVLQLIDTPALVLVSAVGASFTHNLA